MIEANCNKCKNCTGNGCLKYGSDADVATQKCANDGFNNYIEKQDYEIEYDQFWKIIVENEDGTLNKDQIMRELSDYSMIIDNCTKAYCLMTNQNISKPNTKFFEVEGIFNQQYLNKDDLKDDLRDMISGCSDIEELKEELKSYFELSDEDE